MQLFRSSDTNPIVTRCTYNFVYRISLYREKLKHDEIVFNANGTVSAVPKHPLEWNAELSMGNQEDDMFMLPNIALLVSDHVLLSSINHPTKCAFIYTW